MEQIVAGAMMILSLIPKPISQEARNSTSLEQIAKNISSSKPPQDRILQETTPTLTPTPTTQKEKIHIVKAGETLNEIAEEYYGSGKYWTVVWNDNDYIEDPRVINSGVELKIRTDKSNLSEDLNPKLASLFEELTKPSPTPTPATVAVAGASAQIQPQGTPSNFDEAYRQAGSRFGIPWEILYGLHFMETGLRDGAISSGYGTGAQGPLQFMPGTWASYGIDGNGDGVADINNAVDAIFGAANYLAAHGGVDNGLKFYGGDSEKAKSAARSRGWNQ